MDAQMSEAAAHPRSCRCPRGHAWELSFLLEQCGSIQGFLMGVTQSDVHFRTISLALGWGVGWGRCRSHRDQSSLHYGRSHGEGEAQTGCSVPGAEISSLAQLWICRSGAGRGSGESSKKIHVREVMSLSAWKAGRTVGHRPFVCACERGTLRGARRCDRTQGAVGAAGGKRDGVGGGGGLPRPQGLERHSGLERGNLR